MLIVCGTPIGNLDDMSFRAIKELSQAEVIYAEDTRVTKKLLMHFDIQRPLRAYHEHNKEEAGKEVMSLLLKGRRVALVSDAGMPCISDPGQLLIRDCIEHEIDIQVIPGPVAFTVALVGSGLSTTSFCFEGFLPKTKKKSRQRLEQLAKESRTLIFYVSPHDLIMTLQNMYEAFGDRNISIGRELTKCHEEFLRGKLSEWVTYYQSMPPRGEYVLVVEGALVQETKVSEEQIQQALEYFLNLGVQKKDAVREVSTQLHIGRNAVYDIAERL